MTAPASSAPGFISRAACPVCANPGGALLYDQPLTEAPIRGYLESFYAPQGGVDFAHLEGARFTLIECRECGLIYQREVGNDALLTLLYDRWIDPAKVFARYDGVHGEEYFYRLARHVANVVQQLGKPPGELRLLDFGMGWGHWCGVARSFGCRVSGTELSTARIAFAEKAGLHVLPAAELAQHQFDFINTEQVFEHLVSPRQVLAELRRSLAPGGLLRLSVPDGWGLKQRLMQPDWTAPKGSPRSLNAVAPLEHLNCFTARSLRRLATEAGLKEMPFREAYAISLQDALRTRLRPWFYRLRGAGGTDLYFSQA